MSHRPGKSRSARLVRVSKRRPVKCIVSAAVIAAAVACQGQSNVYSLNICSPCFINSYDSFHEYKLGPPSRQFGLREYKVHGMGHVIEWFHWRTSPNGVTTGGTETLVSFGPSPFGLWVSPLLLWGLVVAAVLGLVTVVCRAIYAAGARAR